jgi:hypothetical protein
MKVYGVGARLAAYARSALGLRDLPTHRRRLQGVGCRAQDASCPMSDRDDGPCQAVSADLTTPSGRRGQILLASNAFLSDECCPEDASIKHRWCLRVLLMSRASRSIPTRESPRSARTSNRIHAPINIAAV